MLIGAIQLYVLLALALIAFGLELWALIHALRTPGRSFVSADKRTKNFWTAILGGAVVVGFLCIPPPIGFSVLPTIFLLIAIVPAGVYLADVRPAVDRYKGNRGSGGSW